MVGLGPAGPDLVTRVARDSLDRSGAGLPGFVRTVRHPAAADLAGFESFDYLYESVPSMEEVYGGIVEVLVSAALSGGEVLYAVPGSPLVLERSVALLRRDGRVQVDLVAGMSFLDLAWARLGVDPVDAGVRLVDGEDFAVAAAGERGPLLVAQCWSRDVLSRIKLSVEEAPQTPVTVLSRLGLPDEALFEVGWDDLDRVVEPDHLTSLWIPALEAPVGVELARLVELVRTLRQRCPWDREQTHASLSRHLIEEAYEVVEAIDGLDEAAGEGYGHLEEELGDLLVQVCFHSTLAAEEGAFNLADVARSVHNKLVGRHPHVFGRARADDSAQVMSNWEQIKQVEKGRASVMDGLPPALPALLAASKVLGKATSVGADRRGVAEAMAGVRSAISALDAATVTGANGPRYTSTGARGALLTDSGAGAGDAGSVARAGRGEVGRALFGLVGLSRRLGVDPEEALRQAVSEYRADFATLEAAVLDRQTEISKLDAEELAALWPGAS